MRGLCIHGVPRTGVGHFMTSKIYSRNLRGEPRSRWELGQGLVGEKGAHTASRTARATPRKPSNKASTENYYWSDIQKSVDISHLSSKHPRRSRPGIGVRQLVISGRSGPRLDIQRDSARRCAALPDIFKTSDLKTRVPQSTRSILYKVQQKVYHGLFL